ncbi:T9SS type A sorting domain-containing protein [Hymenobacter sp. BT683]|uniref:T9SS type A sorting domain-containing protein n=1 Tax=Hymenobacter jeongseonensis TaxID=2791027 RepID=A0ABS0ILI5_9BACT|nr:kelch repeat-containing protein [Hymenobacter jeongseonensis]MBF9239235.1 T9SS type A sorting domain-containing protein [Hymenobacter jeongseonensis]
MQHFSSFSKIVLIALSLSIAGSAQAQNTLTFTAQAALLDGGRYGMAYCQDQTAFYMVGGGSLTAPLTADVFRYDIAANSWGTAPISSGQVAAQRFGTAAIIAPNTSASLIYTLNAATLAAPVASVQSLRVDGTSAGNFSNPTPASTAGVAVWNGLIYAYGGQLAGGVYTNQLRSYNPATNIWTTLAPMPEAKNTFGAAVNGKIYAFGGYNGVANSNRIDAYDIATNTWQALGTLPTTVSNQAVAVQGDVIWLIGDFINLSYLAAYNTSTGVLRTFTSNLPPRRNAAAAIAGNFLYVWGGNTASAGSATLSDMWRANVESVVTATTGAASRSLLQAYPNPSATGRLTLALPGPAAAQLTVVDAQGRLVRTLPVPAGSTKFDLNLAGQAAGLYQVRWEAAGQPAATCRIVRQ